MSLYKSNNLKIYNSLTKKKETFKPVVEGRVGMYVCGPTVYSNVHLGNLRTFMSFDVIFRYFKHLGYKVRYVRNITDVGHIENDEDSGEDKIAKKARLEQIEPMEIAQKYTVDFHETLKKINNLPPSIEPTATGHIIDQIEMIKKIIENGYAYVVNDSVYFDVIKYNKHEKYGVLSGINIEENIHETRALDGQSEKRAPQDFALWKRAEESHIMRWPSPWGEGFPGWHLECTAMSSKYLGEKFDIHGGGIDLKFPHHECEIAQSNACYGKEPANFWLHTNMLIMNGQKMSKSTGNFILPHEIFSGKNKILTKPFSPSATRFFMLQASYRSVLDFTSNGIEAAEKAYSKLMAAIKTIETIQTSSNSSIDFNIVNWKQRCYEAMNDDFNTPILIATLFEAVKLIQAISEGKEVITAKDLEAIKETMQNFTFDVLGLEEEKATQTDDKLNGVMNLLIELRNQARNDKNWKMSDKIRDELAALDIELKDGKEGTNFSVNN